ncbi:MAG TPA: alpha-glucan family phosphorylase [Verrucomicrobiae bacterium]
MKTHSKSKSSNSADTVETLKQRFVTGPIHNFLPLEVEGFDALVKLALDLRSSWNHAAAELWRQLDAPLWDLTHNPWVILQTVSHDHLKRTLANPAFREQVRALVDAQRQAAEAPAWFQQQHAGSPLTCVAYFSLEFMLSEALPIYSGGLGNVAGDQLKAADDLGVPVVGIGLLYQQGYFRQVIGRDGSQHALFPYNDPGQLPITPVRDANGEWLRIEIKLPGYSLWLRAWQVQVGRVKLYLLDSNDAANFPAHRGITSELYGGGAELRLKQELVLGVGGWRLLRALGLKPEVCHLNEGHAAFAVLERARSFMEDHKVGFEEALAVTRAGNLFTTHTAVAAGFDCFPPTLLEPYVRDYARLLGLPLHEFLALGRLHPNDATESFNMAYLAMRGSGVANAVSELHGQVSRRIFAPLFPRLPEAEVPIGHVTNGVHMPSWGSAEADRLWTKVCGEKRWEADGVEQKIRALPDTELWQMRSNARKALVDYARQRLARQLAVAGEPATVVDQVRAIFNPDVLTLGFARRFATYKRPDLLLRNPDRLLRLLNHPQRPVQLVIAGKAHPADGPGQALIREWVQFSRRPEARNRVIFLSDYDMLLTRRLVQGVDVWLNNPRRPWEACGTSGMKVLANGGINLSELDGWWAEAYTPELGWALGDGQEHDASWDPAEAEALYDLLEERVAPEFYSRGPNDIPAAWVARMRESMARLTPQFSASRTVREYTTKYYLPAAAACRTRSRDQGAFGSEVIRWRKTLERYWKNLRFGDLKCQTAGDQHVFETEVYLAGLAPETVRVELFADTVNGSGPYRQAMKLIRPLTGAIGGYIYRAEAPAARPASDYTPRIVPNLPGVTVPFENSLIVWQR